MQASDPFGDRQQPRHYSREQLKTELGLVVVLSTLKASFTAPGTSVLFEQFRDQGGDAAAFRPRQRHMPKQRITFQDLHDCTNPVVSTDPQIVALCDVVGEHNFGVVPHPGHDRQ